MNFACRKWDWKDYRSLKGLVVLFDDDGKGETGCVRSGSANFWAVEPRPWRMMRVVLWDESEGMMRGVGRWVVWRLMVTLFLV